MDSLVDLTCEDPLGGEDVVGDDEDKKGDENDGGVPEYHDKLASAYYKIADAEAEQEELLDNISKQQRVLAELQSELRISVKTVTQTRVELEKVHAQIERAQKDQEREETERRDLQRQLDTVQSSSSSSDDAPVSQVVKDLILTKTKLAEVTEERDRRRLDNKRLEEELAIGKIELAALMAEADDTEAKLDMKRTVSQ